MPHRRTGDATTRTSRQVAEAARQKLNYLAAHGDKGPASAGVGRYQEWRRQPAGVRIGVAIDNHSFRADLNQIATSGELSDTRTGTASWIYRVQLWDGSPWIALQMLFA
jgi:hypothetical protein